ncbi:MAG: sigma-54 interaction domain-containing protein [Ignavibacteria bacterium]
MKLSRTILNEAILDSMPGLAYIYTKEGRLVAWNKRCEEILGYSSEEMNNRFLLDFVHAEDKERVRKEVQRVFECGFSQVEHRILTKEGKGIHFLGTGQLAEIEGEEYLIGLAMDTTELVSAREKIKEQMKEINRLNELLNAENKYLKDQLKTVVHSEMIGDSEALRYIFFKIKQVAPTDATVLIEGETGTGKELVARAIHEKSSRRGKPFIKVNCASIPENLIESELFGHEKGSFTGAVEKRIGRFEIADGGTIFLDEIGEIPVNIQSKLLHVLQHGEFERIGSSKTLKTDVRIIAATNKVLLDEIKAGSFRRDLYYRLNVFPISVAPLRERKSDIPALVEYFTSIFSKKFNKQMETVPKEAMQMLMEYDWPGNIRELENMIERGVITSNDEVLNIEPLPKTRVVTNDNIPLEEFEKTHILSMLEKTNWKISGNGGAASLLKINPETLRSKMRKLGIRRI